jgi:hypothetical protein
MKSMYVPILMALALFGIARADNPPAAAATAATGAAATASAATPATPAVHTPVKAEKPWRIVTHNGKTQYCRDELRANSRIPDLHCVDEAQYVKELADSQRAKQDLLQGAHTLDRRQ